MDSTFYEKFYSHMTKGTFIGMTRASRRNSNFQLKCRKRLLIKRLDIKKGAMMSFEEFQDKISPLKTANKLDAILFQIPPSLGHHKGFFTVDRSTVKTVVDYHLILSNDLLLVDFIRI